MRTAEAARVVPLSEEDSREFAVKAALTAERRRRFVENREFGAFARRIVRAFSRRVGSGDVEALPDLIAFARDVDVAIGAAVRGLREYGYTWAEIGMRLGVSRQVAQERWAKSSTAGAEQVFLPTLERAGDRP